MTQKSNNKLYGRYFMNYIINLSNTQIIISFLILFIIGIIIFSFSFYPFFFFHQLSLLAVGVITIFTLKSIATLFNKIKREINLDTEHKALYHKINKYRNSNINIVIPGLMTIFYFINIYLLGYFEINIVGIYAIILGSSALFLALFCYVQFVIIIIYIYKMQEIHIKGYKKYIPANTDWVICISKKINIYKIIFFIVGLIFTLQYAMLSPSNAIIITSTSIIFSVKNQYSYILTWGGILLFIIIGFPTIAYISECLVKSLIRKLKTQTISELEKMLEVILNSKTYEDNKRIEFIKAYSDIIKDIQNSSDYPIKKNRNILPIIITLITISVHLSNLVLNVSKIISEKF